MFFSIPPTAIIIFVGTVVVAAGGVWATYKQAQFETELKENQKILDAKNEEIIKLNQQIAVLSLHTVHMVTGGDSYMSILLGVNGSESISDMTLMHHGIFPIYDLNIKIFDVDNHRDIAVIPVGTIGSIQHIQYWPVQHRLDFDMRGKTSQRINILFYARNGTWYQQNIYKKVNDKWTLATRVVFPDRNFDHKEENIVYKNISRDFPIAETDIEWN